MREVSVATASLLAAIIRKIDAASRVLWWSWKIAVTATSMGEIRSHRRISAGRIGLTRTGFEYGLLEA